MSLYPILRHIDDIRETLNSKQEFILIKRDGLLIADYVIRTPETFGSFTEEISPENLDAIKLCREIRGIKFYEDSGKIAARPLHKFFNINEMPETQAHLIPYNKNVIIPEKMDGSMIHTTLVNGVDVAMTRKGYTEAAIRPMNFLNENENYQKYVKAVREKGYTPIFEWCDPLQRIVILYKTPMMISLQNRHLITGDYMTPEEQRGMAKDFGVLVPNLLTPPDTLEEFVQYVTNIKDQEGYILQFPNLFVKIKGEEYRYKHGLIDDFSREKLVVQMIVNETVDDVAAALQPEMQKALYKFQKDFLNNFMKFCADLEKDFEKLWADHDKNCEKMVKIGLKNISDPVTADLMHLLFKNRNRNQTTFETVLKHFQKTISIKKERINTYRRVFGNICWQDYYKSLGLMQSED